MPLSTRESVGSVCVELVDLGPLRQQPLGD